MTYKLVITDEVGRVVVFAKADGITFDRNNEIAYGEYPPHVLPRLLHHNDRVSISFKALPQKDGSLIKYYTHPPLDKLASDV